MAVHIGPNKRQQIVNDYLTGNYSNIDLAKKYGITNSTVRNVLIREGVYVAQRGVKAASKIVSQKEMFYQKQVLNPYPTGSQSYTAYEKGFVECFNHFFNQHQQQ